MAGRGGRRPAPIGGRPGAVGGWRLTGRSAGDRARSAVDRPRSPEPKNRKAATELRLPDRETPGQAPAGAGAGAGHRVSAGDHEGEVECCE